MKLYAFLIVEKTLFKFWIKERTLFFTFLFFILCSLILSFTKLPSFLTVNSYLLSLIILFMFYTLDNELVENHFYDVFSINGFWQHIIKVTLIYTLFLIFNLPYLFIAYEKSNMVNIFLIFITSYLYACQLDFKSLISKIILLSTGNLLIIIFGILGKIYLLILMTIITIFYSRRIKHEQNY